MSKGPTLYLSPTTDDVWIVVRHDGPWLVGYRLIWQEHRLVPGELRIVPVGADGDGHPLDARDAQSLHAATPRGGITATLVHQITPGSDIGGVVQLIARGLRSRQNAELRRRLLALGVRETTPQPVTGHRTGGPPGKGMAYYRNVVRVYLSASESEHPVQAVAKALRISPSRARDAVSRARHRYGLLPGTSRGKAGAGYLGNLSAIISEPLHVFDHVTVRLQRIATEVRTGGTKAPQVPIGAKKKARQSTREKRRA